jgi:hypothetical protein
MIEPIPSGAAAQNCSQSTKCRVCFEFTTSLTGRAKIPANPIPRPVQSEQLCSDTEQSCEYKSSHGHPNHASMNGKYTVELCRPGGEDTGIERVFERQDDLAIAHKLYRTIAAEYPGRVVMLCDRARVLARSDRLAMPE